MLRKLLILMSFVLIMLAGGLGIVAHAFYIAAGEIDQTIMILGGAAVAAFVVALMLLAKIKRQKPIDLSQSISGNLQGVMLGCMVAGIGLILIAVVGGLFWEQLGLEDAKPGASPMIAEIETVYMRDALQWLHATFGNIGPVLPFVVLGLFCLVTGWRLIRPKRVRQV